MNYNHNSLPSSYPDEVTSSSSHATHRATDNTDVHDQLYLGTQSIDNGLETSSATINDNSRSTDNSIVNQIQHKVSEQQEMPLQDCGYSNTCSSSTNVVNQTNNMSIHALLQHQLQQANESVQSLHNTANALLQVICCNDVFPLNQESSQDCTDLQSMPQDNTLETINDICTTDLQIVLHDNSLETSNPVCTSSSNLSRNCGRNKNVKGKKSTCKFVKIFDVKEMESILQSDNTIFIYVFKIERC